MRLPLVAAALIALAPAATVSAAHADEITIFAAASLKDALDGVAAEWQASHKDDTLVISYAGSSQLAKQIQQGAPADLFISADSDWMDYVAQRGLIAPASRRDLVTNHLALIAPASSKTRLTIGKGMNLNAALAGGRLAMAGPDVPAGRYGRAALNYLGVWPSVQDRVVSADNVRNAMLFVSRGEAPLGVVYDTDALVDPKVRIVGLFPDRSHPRIVYPAAIVKSSTNPAGARFMTFLRSRAAQDIFRRYGFTPL